MGVRVPLAGLDSQEDWHIASLLLAIPAEDASVSPFYNKLGNNALPQNSVA